MKDFLAERVWHTKPIRNPTFITVASCQRCDWTVIFADRDHYVHQMVDAHKRETKHAVNIVYKGKQRKLDI